MHKDKMIYSVLARKWGERDSRAYVVGICYKKYAAIKLAEEREKEHGEKFGCEVEEWDMTTNESKIIREPYDGKASPLER